MNMKKLIDEINLVLKIHRTLGVVGSKLAICYLLFANGSYSAPKLNITITYFTPV